VLELLFDWDTKKAKHNLSKHGVSFEDAMGVFLDPDALTIFDEDNSGDEDRWITLGAAQGLKLLLVVHTHVEMNDQTALIRIISARRPTRREAAQYRHRVER